MTTLQYESWKKQDNLLIFSGACQLNDIQTRLKCINTRKPLDSLLNQGASLKMAVTYSPTVTQYHQRDEA